MNIYPCEVEGVLVLHPVAADAAVTGLSDEEGASGCTRWSSPLTDRRPGRPRRGAADVRPRPDHALQGAQHVSIEVEFPRLLGGKVLHRVLADQPAAQAVINTPD